MPYPQQVGILISAKLVSGYRRVEHASVLVRCLKSVPLGLISEVHAAVQALPWDAVLDYGLTCHRVISWLT